MISKAEILSVADETGLTPNVVEKDYVLGWLLGAINANPVLSQSWVFKSGTCLKKCFFRKLATDARTSTSFFTLTRNILKCAT